MKCTILCLALLILIDPAQSLSAQCKGTTRRDAVQKFFDLDYNGYRLSSAGHSAIWAFTEENGEPPAMPVIVTKTRRIVSEKVLSNGLCSMGIEFSILGIVSEGESGLEFKLPKTLLEKKQVEVKCAGETCRINLEFGHFRVPPHPGKKAVEDWLDGLEKIQKSVEEANRIRTLKSQISSLN